MTISEIKSDRQRMLNTEFESLENKRTARALLVAIEALKAGALSVDLVHSQESKKTLRKIEAEFSK